MMNYTLLEKILWDYLIYFFGSPEPQTKEEIAIAIAREEEKLGSIEANYIYQKNNYQKYGGSTYAMTRAEQEVAHQRAKIAGLQARLIAKMND